RCPVDFHVDVLLNEDVKAGRLDSHLILPEYQVDLAVVSGFVGGGGVGHAPSQVANRHFGVRDGGARGISDGPYDASIDGLAERCWWDDEQHTRQHSCCTTETLHGAPPSRPLRESE